MKKFQIYTYMFRPVMEQDASLPFEDFEEVDVNESLAHKQDIFGDIADDDAHLNFANKKGAYGHRTYLNQGGIIVMRIANNKRMRVEKDFSVASIDNKPSALVIIDNRKPVWGRMTRQQQRTVDAKLHEAFALSFDETGCVMPEHEMSLPFLCGEMNIWLERKRLEAAKAGSIAIDTFRRRAALNGFRAGMMAHWLWGESPRRRKDVTAFALFIADLTLDGQLRRFANQLEVGEGQESPSLVLTRNNNRTIALYDSLPDVFTTADVAHAASEFLIKTPARNVIYGWKSAGLIEKTDVSQFRKLGS